MSAVQKKVSKASDVNAERSQQPADEVAALDPMHALQQSAGNQAMLRLLSGGTVLLQKKEKEGGAADQQSESEPSQKPAAAAPSLIVEDDAKEVKAGQMRKSDFLSQLRTAATSAAETALAGTMWSAMGCPYIDRWLDHYSKQPSAYLERALHKYVPESASVRSASEYIPLVQQRLRRGIEEWRATGEVKDLPPEFASGGMPGMTAGGLLGGLVGGALSAIGGAISSAVSGIGSALSSVGKMMFKRHEGGEGETTEDPAAIQAQLGGGHSLDSATQRRMQSAFGVDFGGVRVHTNTRARELTEGMQARAFTIGSDIAFGGDEYKPGTPVGDALIAHELAHVVQQGSGNAAAAGAQHKGGDSGSLEEDADRSAVGAVMKLWSGASGELSQLGQQAMPGMRSGLRLQRCGSTPKKTESTTPGKPVALSGDWEKDVKAAKKDKNEDMMAALVKKALEGKYEVSVAGKSKPKKVEAADYQPLPVINLDINLNKKQRPTGGGLKDNIGLNFRDGKSGNKYAILGPDALDPVSPLITRMYADHEMYLAKNKLGEGDLEEGTTENDDELEAWTIDFINYFPQYLSIGTGRPIWTPLLDYYSKASADAKKASLAKLKAYYDKPADDKDEKERVQNAISLWVYKWKDRKGIKNVHGDEVSKELIDDLNNVVKPYETKPKKK